MQQSFFDLPAKLESSGSLLAHKGVYSAGGDLIICKNIPGFLLYHVKIFLSKRKIIWSKRKITWPKWKIISKN
jgi:hypothetical protein